ncbi:MAG: polysaccharide deacetylase family protein [Elusimicrobia bacterium]|nr:polysaccharide deacetylase family protein [Elusimicrobiota bacterium]
MFNIDIKFFLIAALSASLTAPITAEAKKTVGHAGNALQSLYTPDYLALKNRLIAQLKDHTPGRFGESVRGTRNKLDTGQKVIALTFDACGGRHSGYNAKLIDYLRREKISATLFVTGLWIDRNPEIFKNLAKDPLFEIENHGLLHRVCSITGQSKFGMVATRGIGDVIDEMELNSRKIAALTGRRPVFFRSATAYTDEASALVAQHLGMEVVSYDIVSGDYIPFASAKYMKSSILKQARHGAIVIMHFNHPEWHELEALEKAVPALRAKGFSFGRLEDFARYTKGIE